MTGVYGKLPSYGDFVRRELANSFVQPWDAWLQAGLGPVRDAMDDSAFAALWAAAPAWRFRLPAGLCGPADVVGVMLTSADAVGRRFPLTLAAQLDEGESLPNEAWYEGIERAGRAALDFEHSADVLLATLQPPDTGRSISMSEPIPAPGWWTGDGRRWPLTVLPTPAQFRRLLEGQVGGEGLDAQAVSHRGTVRSRNEDAFVERADIGLWAVADGAGGHGAGDVASAAVARALIDLPTGLTGAEILAQVRLRLGAVNTDLQRLASESATGETPVTTVVVLMARGGHFACLWAGDSRAYLLREGELQQITRDHSLVQELVASGLVSPEDAESHPQANVITRAVGSPEPLELDKVSGRLQAGDVLLMCSDGLFKALPEAELAGALLDGCSAQQLLDQALQAGARDNVTVVVVRVP